MIIIKTEEFHRQFLYDLANLSIYRKEYLSSIEKWDEENKLETIGFGKQPSKTIKFFGSYFTKKYGSKISDIDFIQIINNVSDPNFFIRLTQIFANLKRTNFTFIRFYCGYIKGLKPPWKLGENFDCDFDVDIVEKWLKYLREKHTKIYDLIKPFLDKETISMGDLVSVHKKIEPYISLVWNADEIIKGYKIHNNIKYSLSQKIADYDRPLVIKFLYKYKDTYCLVDYNLTAKDRSIVRDYDIIDTYSATMIKKTKALKRMIRHDKIEEFISERSSLTGTLTPLLAYVEMLEKIKKFKIMDDKEILKMESQAKKYAEENNINTIKYEELNSILEKKLEPLYEKYILLIDEQKKERYFIQEIRKLQLDIQVPKNILRQRYRKGYDCSVFPNNIEEIKIVYRKANDAMIDPFKLYNCLNFTSFKLDLDIKIIINILGKNKYKIVWEKNLYVLFDGGKKIDSSDKLKTLQKRCLFE